MTWGRSVSSAKFSGDALKERHTGAGSSGVTANIFPPTLNSRSLPHCICSVAPAKERQTSRNQSTFMRKSLSQQPYPLQPMGFPEPSEILNAGSIFMLDEESGRARVVAGPSRSKTLPAAPAVDDARFDSGVILSGAAKVSVQVLDLD